MPDRNFDPSSISDIKPRRLSGSVESDSRPTWLRFELACNVSVDVEARDVLAEATVECYGADSADSEDSEELIFQSAVTVRVIFEDDAEMFDDEDFAGDVLRATWPHMRATLADHGRRLGAPKTSLPMSLEAQIAAAASS